MLCLFKKQISCSCGGAYSSQNTQKLQPAEEIKSVKVLGSGCKNCHMLKENTDAALKELGLNIEAEYVTDIQKIMSYNILSTPALVINEQVVSTGKVLSSADIIISMGCYNGCLYINQEFTADWQIANPTGKSDDEFIKVINQIKEKVLQLKNL